MQINIPLLFTLKISALSHHNRKNYKNTKNIIPKTASIKTSYSAYTSARFQRESLSRVLSYWTANHTQAAVTLHRCPPLLPPFRPPGLWVELLVYLQITCLDSNRFFITGLAEPLRFWDGDFGIVYSEFYVCVILFF